MNALINQSHTEQAIIDSAERLILLNNFYTEKISAMRKGCRSLYDRATIDYKDEQLGREIQNCWRRLYELWIRWTSKENMNFCFHELSILEIEYKRLHDRVMYYLNSEKVLHTRDNSTAEDINTYWHQKPNPLHRLPDSEIAESFSNVDFTLAIRRNLKRAELTQDTALIAEIQDSIRRIVKTSSTIPVVQKNKVSAERILTREPMFTELRRDLNIVAANDEIFWNNEEHGSEIKSREVSHKRKGWLLTWTWSKVKSWFSR